MPSPVERCAPGSTCCGSAARRWRRLQRLLTALGLLACALLLSSCLPRTEALPDPSIPHRVADEAAVVVWVRRPDGLLVRETVRLLPGWWVASPQVVGPETR